MTRCPLDDELVQAYFAHDLDVEESNAIEDHVFSCPSCARAYERWGEQATRLRGLVSPVISRERLDSLIAGGEQLRVTPVYPGAPVSIEFSSDLAYLVHSLRADLAGATQVDVELRLPDGTPAAQLMAVPFDPVRGEVLIACQRHFMGRFPPRTLFHVVARFEDTGERLVGNYVVDHVVP